MRLDEAEHLFRAGYFSGAYYLAGYAVECALKACIARATQQHDFPDKKRVNDSYSHDLAQLLRTAGLEQALKNAGIQNPLLGKNWATVQEWDEGTRYQIIGQEDATSILNAVGDREEGLLLWLTHHW